MKTLGIITARGGSKRIPRKNIKPFCGRPIIEYSLHAAQQAGCFDAIMCSTDDLEIAEISRSNRVEVPFFSSSKNSNDVATTADVLKEVINCYEKLGMFFDFFCCIYPTAPFVSPSRIKSGLELLIASGANAAVPVVQYSYPIQRALQLVDNRLTMIDPKHAFTRSQDLKPSYHDAGQYYWYKMDAFKSNPDILLLNPIPIITPESEVQDIDTEEDWKLAEIKFKIMTGSDQLHV